MVCLRTTSLKGSADMNNDGDITLEEVYGFVASEVETRTNGSQTPMRKGEIQGTLILRPKKSLEHDDGP